MIDDVRRFLRYILPGASAVIELGVLVSLSSPPWPSLDSLVKVGIAQSVSALIGFAALGYAFSVFHHVLLWSLYTWFHWTSDYRPLLRHAEFKKWLSLDFVGAMYHNRNYLSDDLTVPGAWRIVTALWHERVNSSEPLKSANPRSDSFADIVHGTGAAFVGSMMSVAAWIVVVRQSPQIELHHIAVAAAAVILVGHWFALVATIRHSESFVQMVLGNALRVESEKAYAPVHCIVTARDIQKGARKSGAPNKGIQPPAQQTRRG